MANGCAKPVQQIYSPRHINDSHLFDLLSTVSDSLEWLDPSVAEKSYFLIPILDGSCPICLGAINALLVDEKILPGLEPIDLTALCTVMCKVALVSMFLGHASQFIVPLLMKKMAYVRTFV